MEDGRLGKYVISGILGKGAMGTVYDAHDPIIDRRVAIKTLTLPDAGDTETQEELARFKREAQAAGRLTHPNIVGVFDYGETAKLAYIVMEFVDGPSLKSLLDKNERFPTGETVRIMEALLAGLQFSHERGVVHRDIKPANVMLTRDGQVKIADFGIARIESSSMTQAGTIMGTPAYMSPEQFMGQTVDARTDIYSSGVLLYQMLTGERPFEGSMTAIMHKVLNVAPPNPLELSVTAPQTLDGVVARAMAKRPEQRYANAAEFAQALRAAAQGQAVATPADDADATMVAPPPTAPSAPRPVTPPQIAPASRSLVPLLAGVAALVLAAGGGGWYWFAGRTPDPIVTTAVTPAPTPIPLPATPEPPTSASIATPAPTPPLVAPPPAAVMPPTASVVTPTPVIPTPVIPTPVIPTPVTPTPITPTPATATAQPPSPVQLRTALRAALADVPCSLISGQVSEAGNVTLEGLIKSDNEPMLRDLVTRIADRARVDWRIVAFKGDYCETLNVIRPVAPPFGSIGPDVQLTLKGGQLKLRDYDNMVPRLVMPYAGFAQISYFSSDSTMAHLYPSALARQLDITPPGGRLQPNKIGATDARKFPAGAIVDVGDPKSCNCKPEEAGWQVGPPIGVDMMVVITSTEPLFATLRHGEESPADFLRDLQAALADADRRGVRVNARAIPVEILAR